MCLYNDQVHHSITSASISLLYLSRNIAMLQASHKCDLSKLKVAKHVVFNLVSLATFFAAGARQRQIACKIINFYACCFHRSYIDRIIITLLMTSSFSRASYAEQFLVSQWTVWILCHTECCQTTAHTVEKKGPSWDIALMLIWRNMLTSAFSDPVSRGLNRDMSW